MSYILSDKYYFRELTYTGNKTAIEIHNLSNFDEESFAEYNVYNKMTKKDFENESDRFKPEKHEFNQEKIPSDRNDRELLEYLYCTHLTIYPPISNRINEINSNSLFRINQLLNIRDINKIENLYKVIIQNNCDGQVKTKYFNKRNIYEEITVLFNFLTNGIDLEDINYLKQCYDSLLNYDNVNCWLNKTQWVNHPDIL